MPPLLVVVSGPPGSGKTTLGRRLARDLMFPFVSKDGIKERLFESLGWTDREWSRQLGRASVDLLFYVVEVELSAGRSLVVENAFWKENATEPFRRLGERHPCRVVQIHCRAATEVLVRRFRDRDHTDERHPGQVNRTGYGELEMALREDRYGVMDIGGEVLMVDTTDFEAVDSAGLLKSVRSSLATDGL
ncbi:MAG: ATP-binding protein [Chloroflexi bacterium]|nr:ATP-binding protein [Chloroflexota bacterium]